MYKDLVVSVVVPAYNEESLIGETLGSIPGYIDHVFVVDDGSGDGTWEIILECQGKDPRIVSLQHEKNRGVGAAIITGYRKALEDGVDVAVVMAGDNQMDPGHIPDLLDPIVEGRAVYSKGNRLMSEEYRRGMSRWRTLGNMMLTFLTKLASGYWQIMDPQNGFTAISRRALEALDLDRVYAYYGYCNDLLVKLNVYGFKVLDVQIPARYGNERSKIRYASYIVRVSWMLLRNFFWRLKMKYVILSFNPVVFFYLAGLMITPVSIVFGVYSLHYYFVQGGPLFIRAALSLLLFIVGMQFLFFAMLFDMQNDRNA
ncbi:MAG: glycosyltransferase family 2 protein [Candidatus Bathyarchaeota archaeon]